MSSKKNNYIDFHCHSAMKPFGKSYNYKIIGRNNPDISRTSSIWRYNPPTLVDKLINYIIHLTKFSQSIFSSLAKGGITIICISLYPIEKWFVVNKIKNEFIKDIASNFATGVRKKRVDAVQDMTTASFKVKENNIKADEIISRIISSNGIRFLKSYFK